MKDNGKKKKKPFKRSLVDEKEKSSKVACIVKARMSFACHLFTTGGPQS